MTAGGKGHARRRENTALVEANWPFPDRKADQAAADAMRAENLSNAQTLRGVVANTSLSKSETLGSEPSGAATFQVNADTFQAPAHYVDNNSG